MVPFARLRPGMRPLVDRRFFIGTLAGSILAAPFVAETFSGSCQAICV